MSNPEECTRGAIMATIRDNFTRDLFPSFELVLCDGENLDPNASNGSASVSSDKVTQTSSDKILDGLGIEFENDAHLINWSRTHEANPSMLFEPDSVEQLIEIVAYAQATGRHIRPVGTFCLQMVCPAQT